MPDKPSFKQLIRSEIVTGVGVPMNVDRARLEDILSKAPYDFVSVDSQHSAFSEDRLATFCAMAEELDMPVMFRIKHTRNTYLVGNYLDLGPSGLQVPEVESESTVDEALDYFYYPQVGKRSWRGDARARIAARPDRLEYAEWWNSHGVLSLQLESVEAVTNVRRLAKPGVGLLTFGPSDLNFSLEAHRGHPFKTVDDCIRYVVSQVKDRDVRINVGASTPEDREKYGEMGITVFQEAPRS